MKKYTTVLLGIAAIIGFIGLSATPAFTDSIHNALDNNRVANETVETKAITVKFDSTPWTIQDYVDNARAAIEANDAVEFEAIADVNKPATNG